MALLPILQYPDPRLHKVAKSVVSVTEQTRKLIKDMAETMYAAPGVGLAATQVDVHERIVVIDVSEEHNDLKVLINPVLLNAEGEEESEEGEEGEEGEKVNGSAEKDQGWCLSLESTPRSGEAGLAAA